MKPKARTIGRGVLIVVVLLIALFAVQRGVDSRRSVGEEEKYLFLPDAENLMRFTFGFDALICDIYWLRVVQYVGEKHYSQKGFEWLFHSLDLITELDSKFDTAYYFGGIVLTFMPQFVDRSDKILLKGLRSMPDKWIYPWLIGFNNYFYRGDFEKASEFIMMASRIPGSPDYLPFLASKLLTEANRPETAISFLEKMYNQSEDPVIRERIMGRIKLVIVERDIIYLEGKVGEFFNIYGRKPMNIEEMVTKKVIGSVPPEPFGGYYYLESETGSIMSSEVKSRLKLYLPRKKR